MHELVLVLSDLYIAQETPERQLPEGVSLPGLQHVARFATRRHLPGPAHGPGGWRQWLSHWLAGRGPESVATVAAFALTRSAAAAGPATREPPSPAAPAHSATHVPTSGAALVAPLASAATVWMATPVHLVAGLTSVHLDRRSILRLSADDQTALAAEFQRVFHDSGFHLQPLDSGDFLLLGPQSSVTGWSEPSRAMGASVSDARGTDNSDPALRRLGAEIEMWLHEHPVNAVRARRGEAPVTGLWLWGGGPSPGVEAPTNARASGGASTLACAAATADIAFGNDAFLQGLGFSVGQKVLPLPPRLADVFSYPDARRAALVIEIGPMLHTHPNWTFFDAIAQIDRDFVAPATAALRAGSLDRLVILANDYQLTLRARDRFKLWRRTPLGLSGLQ